MMRRIRPWRPERWRSVGAEVPLVDVATTMFDTSISQTGNERDERGHPRRRDEFDWVLACSPYDNPPPAGSHSSPRAASSHLADEAEVRAGALDKLGV